MQTATGARPPLRVQKRQPCRQPQHSSHLPRSTQLPPCSSKEVACRRPGQATC